MGLVERRLRRALVEAAIETIYMDPITETLQAGPGRELTRGKRDRNMELGVGQLKGRGIPCDGVVHSSERLLDLSYFGLLVSRQLVDHCLLHTSSQPQCSHRLGRVDRPDERAVLRDLFYQPSRSQHRERLANRRAGHRASMLLGESLDLPLGSNAPAP